MTAKQPAWDGATCPEGAEHAERLVDPARVRARHAVAAAGDHARAEQQQQRLVREHGAPAQDLLRALRRPVRAAAQAAAAQHAPAPCVSRHAQAVTTVRLPW